MNIAIVGYGSLVWDLDDLAPQVEGPWRRGAGPRLPIEFARISQKRQGALGLVIDEAVGDWCATSVIASSRRHLEEAVTDLARRERCPRQRIGRAERGKVPISHLSSAVTVAIAGWIETSPFDAALWTELDANFAAETGAPFTHAAAEGYLRGLEGESLAEAWRYIESAPEETDTPLRRHLRAQDWWRALAFGPEGSGFRAAESA